MTTLPDPGGHAAVVRRAAEVLERNGRAVGQMAEPAPGLEPSGWPVCVIGALRLGSGSCFPSERIYTALSAENALAAWLIETGRADDGGTPAKTIAGWNDPIADDGEVVAVLREFASREMEAA